MASLADLKFYLSGTDGKTGGAIGANQVLSQTATGITTLTGVTINDACGNAEGVGSLYYSASAKTLSWTPYGGAAGTAVNVSVSGDYAIEGYGNSGLLMVTVVAASLPGSSVTNSITVANRTETIFDDVTKDESYAGVTRYRCLYLKNVSSDAKKAVKLYIADNTPGADTVSIGLDPAGVNGTAATIANENTAPAGVTFTAPTTVGEALSIGDLAANAYYPFWIKELVPAGVTEQTDANTFRLAVNAYV